MDQVIHKIDVFQLLSPTISASYSCFSKRGIYGKQKLKYVSLSNISRQDAHDFRDHY